LKPPQIVELASRLNEYGVSLDISSVDEMVEILSNLLR